MANLGDGWIRLYRTTIDNKIFQKDQTAWHVFETLLLLCDKETGIWEGGRFQLAEMCNIKPSTLYKALVRLNVSKMLTLSSNNRYTAIGIVNWAVFQESGTHPRTTKEHSNKNIYINTVLVRERYIKYILSEEFLKNVELEILAWLQKKGKKETVSTSRIINWLKNMEKSGELEKYRKPKERKQAEPLY